jgi:2-aminoethylphosphonate-pyruvate transaminase
VETFRVGCMGQLGERGMAGAVEAVAEVLDEMGLRRPARLAA